MLILNSSHKSKELKIKSDINVSEEYLRNVVKSIAIPRHFVYESKNNTRVKEWIKNEFDNIGLTTSYQGSYQNIIATTGSSADEFSIIVGAHYDSVPRSPGADDNASAIAGLLAVAKGLKNFGDIPVLYIAFNREEDGLLGSQEFVNSLTIKQSEQIKCAHILEMIGYCSHEPGSQGAPSGLPVKISDVGDFIAIISNRYSNNMLSTILKIGNTYVPELSVKALKVFLGVEKYFPHLLRSDHAPFWSNKIPSLMWTDTSEFRNKNYHKASDTPETLDYNFMRNVVQLLGNTIIQQLDGD